LYPHSRVLTLIPWIFLQIVELPAIVLLGFWFVSARFDGHSYPRVQVTMCDRFVLERAMSIMPGSHIYAVSDKRNVERGWSETWIVIVNGFPAADVMRAVQPWMGSRRTMQIDRSLSAWRPIRVAPRRSSCLVPGCWRR